MILKGQSSIEYLAVVGIGLLMATPFIGLVQEEVFGLRTDSQDARFVSSLDEMESAIERAHALGEPAQSDFVLNLPDNIVFAKIVGGRNIVFTQNRSGQLSNYTRLMNVNVNADDLPKERGSYKMKAESWNSEVNISER